MHGGSKAIAQLIANLSRRHDVALLVLRARGEPGVDDDLRARCEVVEEVYLPESNGSIGARVSQRIRLTSGLIRGTPTWATERMSPTFEQRIVELARDWHPDVVQFEFRIMGQFLRSLDWCEAALVLTDHDPDWASVAADVSGARLRRMLESWAWRRLGREVADCVGAVIVFTDRDRHTMAGLAGSAQIVRIPLGYDLTTSPLDPIGKDPYRIVYVGSFIHPPNVNSAVRLTRQIFPRVQARVPDATLQLVGSYPPSTILDLEDDRVTVTGQVPDVTPYLDDAAVFAAPLVSGGGMRVKVLEALQAGKAIVATRVAVAGLDVVDGEHVFLADSDDEFGDALVTLLEDPAAREAIGRSARQWAELNLDWRTRLDAYDRLYASLLARSAPWRVPASALEGSRIS
jgi:glycosyltransferase involved in cell wall biosynthesis